MGKTVALTFDDGPGDSTAAIVAILKAYDVPATFFNIGENEAARPADVVAEADAGFVLGDHTWNHPIMTTVSRIEQASEIEETIATQVSLIGLPPCVFRPPYGDYNATTLALTSANHLAVWMWSVDPQDWEADGSSSSYWVNRIISTAESEAGALDNPVIVFHNQTAGNPATVEALPTVITWLKDQGYTFVDAFGRAGPPLECDSPSGIFDKAQTAAPTGLSSEESLATGQSLASPDRQCRLVMQRDGNLVLESAYGEPLWATSTNGNAGARAVMTSSGNLVVESVSGVTLWSSDLSGYAGARLNVLDAASVVVDASSGGPVWASKP